MLTNLPDYTDTELAQLRAALIAETQARVDRLTLPATIEKLTRRLKDATAHTVSPVLLSVVEVAAELEPDTVREVAATLPEPAPAPDPEPVADPEPAPEPVADSEPVAEPAPDPAPEPAPADEVTR